MHGRGIGDAVYRGRARVIDDSNHIVNIDRGCVLVAQTMTPSHGVYFRLAGAIVTAFGGPLCHAAIVARELRLPAVVGCGPAIADIVDGTMLEVDAQTGQVSVLG